MNSLTFVFIACLFLVFVCYLYNLIEDCSVYYLYRLIEYYQVYYCQQIVTFTVN